MDGLMVNLAEQAHAIAKIDDGACFGVKMPRYG
jgi:hypothetical protein